MISYYTTSTELQILVATHLVYAIMQKQSHLHQAASLGFGEEISRKLCRGISGIVSGFPMDRRILKSHSLKVRVRHAHEVIQVGFDPKTGNFARKSSEVKSTANETVEELYNDDDDDELCPVDCVKEFKTDEEFTGILKKAKETDSLVVVDFYRTACGSCKYIEQGFTKLCKGSGDQDAPVIFLKHNVVDEYDEQSEVAERLRIKTVPLFHFYKNGVLLEAFPTRDKERILAAILKYTAPASCNVQT